MDATATISVRLQGDPAAYKTILCQKDGYVQHVGALLVNHYNTFKKAIELISLGDIAYLSERACPSIVTYEAHSWEKPAPGVTVAYGRDRGEQNVGPAHFRSLKDILNYNTWYDHAYVYENRMWYKLTESSSSEAVLTPVFQLLKYPN